MSSFTPRTLGTRPRRMGKRTDQDIRPAHWYVAVLERGKRVCVGPFDDEQDAQKCAAAWRRDKRLAVVTRWVVGHNVTVGGAL